MYTKTNWLDQEVENPRTFDFQKNSDGTYTLIDAFGEVTELGTAVNAETMNNIENGIYNSLNLSQVTGCILEAPNGVAEFGDGVITVKSGLRVLLPNGRNNDNTLNNLDLTFDEDISSTLSDYTAAHHALFIKENGGVIAVYLKNIIYSDLTPAIPDDYAIWINKSENKTYVNEDESWVETPVIYIGTLFVNSSCTEVENFETAMPLELLKYSDKKNITSWAMPSSVYKNLTLGSSGTSYTAPADGYVSIFFRKNSGDSAANPSWVVLQTGYIYSATLNPQSSAGSVATIIPVTKGASFVLTYAIQNGYSEYWFRFIYLNGNQSEA